MGIRNLEMSKAIRDGIGKGQGKEKKQVQEKRGQHKGRSGKEARPVSLYFFQTCLSLPWVAIEAEINLSHLSHA